MAKCQRQELKLESEKVLGELVYHHDETVIPSEQKFGLTFGIILILTATYLGAFAGFGSMPSTVILLLGILTLSLGILAPSLLRLPNRLWFKLGMVLYHVVNPIFLGILFFGCITPIAFLLKLFRKDILSLRIEKDKDSYWVKKEPLENGSMKFQF
jgi:hypothetical protein